MPQKTIMIMAGGTGGHVFPALAVAEWLKQQGWRVVWLGAKTGMEANLVPKHGFEMAWVRFSGLRGKGFTRMLTLPLNLLVAFWQSITALRRIHPNVVLGMGGYIAFPGGMMAVLLRYPLVIQEQNSVAGLSNKVLARVADKVLVAFPNAIANAQWSGNPLRAELTSLPSPEQRYASREGTLRVLVLGGSLGAQALNETVPKALALINLAQRPQVTHQAGAKHIEALRDNYAQAGVEAELLPFIDNMAERYMECDLVICRAGAMTVAELSAVGVASILVPFPHAVDDHQTTNARFLSDQQAAILIQQSELSPERLADLLIGMTRTHLLQMAVHARALAKPDATETVARVCMELAR